MSSMIGNTGSFRIPRQPGSQRPWLSSTSPAGVQISLPREYVWFVHQVSGRARMRMTLRTVRKASWSETSPSFVHASRLISRTRSGSSRSPRAIASFMARYSAVS